MTHDTTGQDVQSLLSETESSPPVADELGIFRSYNRPIGVGSEPSLPQCLPEVLGPVPRNATSIIFTTVSQIGANPEIKFTTAYHRSNFNFPKRNPFSWKFDV